MKNKSLKALVIVATLLAGCSKESQTNETATTATNNAKAITNKSTVRQTPSTPNSIVSTTTTIYEAARDGDLEKLNALLQSNPKLVFSKDNKYGATPLHWAAAAGHKNVVELLLTNKADINAIAKDGATPLQWATATGHDEVAEFLRQWDRPAYRPIDTEKDGFTVTCQSTHSSVDAYGTIVSADVIGFTAIAQNIDPRVNGTRIVLLASGNIVDGKLDTKDYGTFQIQSGGSVVLMTDDAIAKIRKGLQDAASAQPAAPPAPKKKFEDMTTLEVAQNPTEYGFEKISEMNNGTMSGRESYNADLSMVAGMNKQWVKKTSDGKTLVLTVHYDDDKPTFARWGGF